MLSNSVQKLNGLPEIRGRSTENAPLGTVGWFRTGGTAEILFKPADQQDLIEFLKNCPADIPVTVLGVMSNTIVRDGGVPGVVIRPGKDFTKIERLDETHIRAGASVLDFTLARQAATFGIAGLEFFSGIPGTIGGALKMNAGAYGTETKDVLVSARYVDRHGKIHEVTPTDLNMTYRHTDTPEDAIFLDAVFKGVPETEDKILTRIEDIKTKRTETQPIKERTGGSTFANPSKEELAKVSLPEDTKVWQLIDKVGGRGLRVGGAHMSELHCNFMINDRHATAHDLETLGETIRKRVSEQLGIALRWEIRRIGNPEA